MMQFSRRVSWLKPPSRRNDRGDALAVAAMLFILTYVAVSPSESQEPQAIQTLAQFPHGTFLENLVIGSNGDVIFTDYSGKRLLRQGIIPANETGRLPAPAATFSALDVHPAGIARLGDGYLVSAHGRSFLEGPEFQDSQLVLLLNANGREVDRVAAPNARFLNGIAVSQNGLALIADSAAGIIWRFDSETAQLTEWLRHPLLGIDEAIGPGRPGVNGLKFRDGRLFVSNSSRGAIFTVGVMRDMHPANEPALYAQTGPIDDFAFDDDGTILAATHGQSLIRIERNGTITSIIREGCDSCTAVALSPDGRGYLVLTTGNLLENGNAPARLLRIDGSRPSPHPR
jgi:hypothetical protein